MDIPKGYVQIKGSNRKPAEGARRIADVDPKEPVTVTFLVRRRPDAEPLPDLEDQASKPLKEQKYLSREDFAKKFGAAPEEIKKVEDFAKAKGLKIIESSAAKRMVTAQGTAEQMNSTFAVKLGHYKTPTETYRGREGKVYLPKNIAEIVEGVLGLDNRRVARRHSTAAGTTSLTPPEVAKLYNFPTSSKGKGQTIGIMELGGGYKKSDIDAFFTGLGLATPKLTDVSVLGATNCPVGGAEGEVVLDIDVAGSVAPSANIVIYFAPNSDDGMAQVITTAVNDAVNKPSVLSFSWGGPEVGFLSANATASVDSALRDAAVMGVTVFASSGDDGSSDGVSDKKAHVNFPASDPFATGCGGTTIKNVSGTSFTEKTWPGTGGGISDVFPLPSWQQGIGVPPSVNDKHVGRGVPDVGGNADPASGYWVTINGRKNLVGGTSATAPLYAGLVALINASLPTRVGYLNPKLYSYGKSPNLGVFRDVKDGVSNATGGAPGYKSGPGWDACTGWGSIKGTALLNALKSTA